MYAHAMFIDLKKKDQVDKWTSGHVWLHMFSMPFWGNARYYLFAWTMLLYMGMQYQLLLIIFSLLKM